jgi:AcrR family transcriptional regulator
VIRPASSCSPDSGSWRADASSDLRFRRLGVRVHDVVAEAEVTSPTLYYYSGSRDGLVIAAQVARYARRTFEDIARIGEAVATCTSSNDLRAVLTGRKVLDSLGAHRCSRECPCASGVGSGHCSGTRPGRCRTVLFEPCRERGWLRPGIDLASAVSWLHSLMCVRIYIERGQANVDPAEWDQLRIEALVLASFGR